MIEILKNYMFENNKFEVLVKNNDKFIGITNGIIKTNFLNSSNITISIKISAKEIIINQVEVMKISKNQFNYFNDDEFYIEGYYSDDDLSNYLNYVKEELDEVDQGKNDFIDINNQQIKNFTLIEEIANINYTDLTNLDNINIFKADETLEENLKYLFVNIKLFKDFLSEKTESEIIDSFDLVDFDKILIENNYSIVRANNTNFSSFINLQMNIEKLNNFDLNDYIKNNKILKLSKDFYDSKNWENEPNNYANSFLISRGNELEKELEQIYWIFKDKDINYE